MGRMKTLLTALLCALLTTSLSPLAAQDSSADLVGGALLVGTTATAVGVGDVQHLEVCRVAGGMNANKMALSTNPNVVAADIDSLGNGIFRILWPNTGGGPSECFIVDYPDRTVNGFDSDTLYIVAKFAGEEVTVSGVQLADGGTAGAWGPSGTVTRTLPGTTMPSFNWPTSIGTFHTGHVYSLAGSGGCHVRTDAGSSQAEALAVMHNQQGGHSGVFTFPLQDDSGNANTITGFREYDIADFRWSAPTGASCGYLFISV